jgi:hypothetical protein
MLVYSTGSLGHKFLKLEGKMIALNEDMAGSNGVSVLAQGLKVCLGLFFKNNASMLFGAHYTPSTTIDDMNKLTDQLNTMSGGDIRWLAMVSKFANWGNAASGLNSPAKLAAYFRSRLHYHSTVHYCDLIQAPQSYDVLCTNGFAPALSWRPTPQTNHTDRPDGHVYKLIRTIDPVQARQGIRVGIAVVTPCDGTNGRAVHNLPVNVDGFTVIPNQSFATSEAPKFAAHR